MFSVSHGSHTKIGTSTCHSEHTVVTQLRCRKHVSIQSLLMHPIYTYPLKPILRALACCIFCSRYFLLVLFTTSAIPNNNFNETMHLSALRSDDQSSLDFVKFTFHASS